MGTDKLRSDIIEELRKWINGNSIDVFCNVPDYVLAEWIVANINALKDMMRVRDKWFGFEPFKATLIKQNPAQDDVKDIKEVVKTCETCKDKTDKSNCPLSGTGDDCDHFPDTQPLLKEE